MLAQIEPIKRQTPFFCFCAGDSPPTRLIVDNLADTVTQVDVEELFSEFGNLVGVSMHYDKVRVLIEANDLKNTSDQRMFHQILRITF